MTTLPQPAPFTFRAIWPVVDHRVPYDRLLSDAAAEVPLLAARAAARLTGPGRFSVALARHVPGSGRVTESVLVYEAPAIQRPPRPYRVNTP